jgi:hypothetical protein
MHYGAPQQGISGEPPVGFERGLAPFRVPHVH